MDELGARVLPGQEASVAETVKTLLADTTDRVERIRQLREKNAVNFGCAGSAVAEELIKMEVQLSGADRA